MDERQIPQGGGVKMPLDYPSDSPLPYGLFSAGIKIYPIYLDNLRVEHEVKISGNLIWAYMASSANANATIKFNTLESDGIYVREGLFLAGVKFSSIYLNHNSQPGEYIYLIYTDDKRTDIRVENPGRVSAEVVISKSPTFDAMADVNVPFGTTVLIAAQLLTRRSIILTNKASNPAPFRIGDIATAANAGFELSPGETREIFTTAAIYAYNDGLINQHITLSMTED